MEQERDEEEEGSEVGTDGGNEVGSEGADLYDFASTGTSDRDIEPKKSPIVYIVAIILLTLMGVPLLALLGLMIVHSFF